MVSASTRTPLLGRHIIRYHTSIPSYQRTICTRPGLFRHLCHSPHRKANTPLAFKSISKRTPPPPPEVKPCAFPKKILYMTCRDPAADLRLCYAVVAVQELSVCCRTRPPTRSLPFVDDVSVDDVPRNILFSSLYCSLTRLSMRILPINKVLGVLSGSIAIVSAQLALKLSKFAQPLCLVVG